MPQLVGKWLGFIVNLYEGNFYIPEDKLESLKSAIKSAYPLAKVPVRLLASVVASECTLQPC